MFGMAENIYDSVDNMPATISVKSKSDLFCLSYMIRNKEIKSSTNLGVLEKSWSTGMHEFFSRYF